jgi:flagellar assembly protein FliH
MNPMALIKSGQTPTSLQPFSMKDIENTARAILVRARQQAEQLVAAAQEQAEQLKQQAQVVGLSQGRQEGYAKGQQEGLNAGTDKAYAEQKSQLTALVTALTQASHRINAQRRELEASAVNDVLNLAIVIAERVTKRQGLLDPQVAVANVNEALRIIVHASDLRVAINPSQRTALDEALPKLKVQWPKLQHVELVADETLEPGGCRVYTTQGQVDGDLNEQLRRIAADLLPGEEAAA